MWGDSLLDCINTPKWKYTLARPQSNRDSVKPGTQGPLVGHALES